MNTKLPTRPTNDDRLEISLPADQKKLAFEAAAKAGVSTSQFVRDAIALASAQAA